MDKNLKKIKNIVVKYFVYEYLEEKEYNNKKIWINNNKYK